VSYAALMSLDGGRYASPELPALQPLPEPASSDDVSRETPADFLAAVIEQVEIAAKYAGYIDRQKDDVQRTAHYERLELPQDLDYMQVSALSIEARQKLNRHKPHTLGQAARLSGITPATISLLLIHLKKTKFSGLVRQDALSDEAADGGEPDAATP
jgi:tRNA uridine 5-carboxymethylaminomethyl modification enzyme